MWFEKIKASGSPNLKLCRIPVPSKLNICVFRALAKDYEDQLALDFLEFGFPINHNPDISFSSSTVPNHKGAVDFPASVASYIQKELGMSGIIGPFKNNPLSVPLAVSPMNTVPKADGVARRHIVDLSFQGINDGIDKDNFLGDPFKLKLPTVDDISALIRGYGPACLLHKRDLSRAYRQFPVDPGDLDKLGFTWEGMVYIDCRLAMGLSSAATGCQRGTQIVGFIFLSNRHRPIIIYLDDFNGVAPPDINVATADFEYLGSLLKQLGLEEAVDKALPPSTRQVMLGILFDTVKMTMEVSPDRVVETLALTADWLKRKHATKVEVQQLLGKLQFVCKCVRQGRVFINRILRFLRTFGKREVRKIPRSAIRDIKWFNIFLSEFNGVSLIPAMEWGEPDMVIATDASLVGCGGVCGVEYFHSVFPPEIADKRCHISELEMLTVAAGVKLWADRCKGKKITIFCDNEATVCAINSGRVRNNMMEACLRELAYTSARAGCELRAIHIPGVYNRLPDFLSRWALGVEFRHKFFRATSSAWRDMCADASVFKFSHNW